MEQLAKPKENMPSLSDMKFVVDLFGGEQVASYISDEDLDMYVDVYKLDDGTYVKTVNG